MADMKEFLDAVHQRHQAGIDLHVEVQYARVGIPNFDTGMMEIGVAPASGRVFIHNGYGTPAITVSYTNGDLTNAIAWLDAHVPLPVNLAKLSDDELTRWHVNELRELGIEAAKDRRDLENEHREKQGDLDVRTSQKTIALNERVQDEVYRRARARSMGT